MLELSASVLAGGEHLQELPGSGATSNPKDTKKYYKRGNIPYWISPAINELKNVQIYEYEYVIGDVNCNTQLIIFTSSILD